MKLLSLLKPYRLLMLVAWFFTLVELIVELTAPILMAKIIDDGVIQEDLQIVIFWGSTLLALSLLSFASGITNSFFSAHVGQNFGFDVRKSIYAKIQNLSFSQLNHYSTSGFITRLTNDVTQVQNTVFMSLRIAIRAPLLILFGTVMALFVHFKLALIFVVMIPILVLFLIWVMRKGFSFFQVVQGKLDQVNRVIRENLQSIRLVKAFYRKDFENERFREVNKDLMENTMKALRFVEFTGPMLLFFMNVSIIIILWLGKGEILLGGAKPGEVVAIINYGLRITGALSMLTWIIMAFSRAQASGVRINEVLKLDEEKVINKGLTEEICGDIQFNNVCFRYHEDSKNVLDNISFHVHHGQTVAILGATGSGKTSLCQLIPRLFDPTEGEIKIAGKDSKEIPTKSLREQIGFVPQDTFLFTGTIRENIAWGKNDATYDEITQAARDAQIEESIIHFPKQYDTLVGQKGVNLSGGQKQRLAIARALIRKPKILLLDDSTSALDLQTERRLLQAIRKLDCTIIMVTQKIETAKTADLILLLENGKLIAKGTHKQLMESSSLYQQIVNSQMEVKGEFDHAYGTN